MMQDARGVAKRELDTPCLVIDETVLDDNIGKMQAHADGLGKKLRPHAKTHKCSRIAKKQVAAGAVGVCAAKVSEAEILAARGLRGVLVTAPVVTERKIERLCTCVAEDPSVAVVVDDAENANALNAAAGRHGIILNVLVDVDSGRGRTGVPSEQALEFGRTVDSLLHLSLKGIQCYAGHVQHIESFTERREGSLACMRRAAAIVRGFRAEGLPCGVFSGAGTGTYDIDSELPELTELQVGSYAVMDAEYRSVGSADNPGEFSAFRPSLTLLTTVISSHRHDFVTVDAGLKALYHHGAAPQVVGSSGGTLTYDWFGDEHGKISFDPAAKKPEAGDVLELVVSHCDPTINLYDELYVVRAGTVTDVWPVDLRGKSQ